MKTSEKIRRAKSLIEKHGWVQGTYGDAECGFCMAGAIDMACNAPYGGGYVDSRNCDARKYVRLVLHPRMITEFNDCVAKDKKEILAMLDQAANLAEKEGH